MPIFVISSDSEETSDNEEVIVEKDEIRCLDTLPDDSRSRIADAGEQKRIKSEFHLLREINENLEPSDDTPHEVTSSPVTFSENKENTPVFERPIKGYTAHQLLDIIVGRRVCNGNICKQVPRGVRTHAAYVVDTEELGSCDILAFGDDNGSWGGHTKPRRKYSVQMSGEVGITSSNVYKPEEDGQPDPEYVYTLYRNYFQHSHTPTFRKVIASVYDWKGNQLPLAVVQYFFEGAIEVPIKLAKHGNAKEKDAKSYMRTSRPVLEKIKKKCETMSCKNAVDKCYEEGGGNIGCTSVAAVPRNRKQAYNQTMHKKDSKTAKSAKRHDFYDVLELLNEGTFVRDFGFAKSSTSQRTQPRSFQATEFQLNELSRICLSRRFSAILSIDATFNCGPFYVTLTSYKNTMFLNKAGKHPVAIGPSIIHTTKEFDDYHYLSSQLKSHCKDFEALQAYGTDGEINIIDAFLCELPEAVHLRCKIHLADNIDRKLTALSFAKTAKQTILNSIFGRRIGDVREKGLADANSADEFDSMLQKMKKQWCEIEATQHIGKAEFYLWFEKHLGQVMKENVISPIRQIAGLGSPPEFYTQNVAECCNRIIKADAGHKMGWSDFCLSIQETAEIQERETKRAIHQGGDYRLAPAFQHLEVKADKWVEMGTTQKESHYERCFSKPLDKLAKVDEGEAEPDIDEEALSVSYKDSGITTMSIANLKQMWRSAANILKKDQGVIPVPWDSTLSEKLVFDGEGKPPCHVVVTGNMVKCGCAKFKSAMICCHSLAVAEDDVCLQEFLSLVRKRKKLPDPHRLIEENLSKAAGKKPKTRRKGKPNAKNPPLMAIREPSERSTTTTATNATSRSDSFDAAVALLELSRREAASKEGSHFHLKCLAGTQVRTCHGCGKQLRVLPHVPEPPHDFCIVHVERRVYFAPDGSTRVSADPQNCHYHLYEACVKRKHNDFKTAMLQIPEGLKKKLSPIHRAWLDMEFHLTL